ncbi:glycosyltransferase family 4 protein [Nitrospinota bacterium]
MKILHIITRLDRGGSADNTLLSCIGQRRRGHEVMLVSGRGLSQESSLTASAQKEGVKLVYLPPLVRAVQPLEDLKALIGLRRIIQSGNFDMVHTHTSKAGILGRFAARFSGAPPVVHTPHGHIFYGYFGEPKTKLFIWAEKLMARWTDVIVTLTDREAEEHLAFGVGRPGQFETIFSGISLKDRSSLNGSRNRTVLRTELGLPPEGELVISAGRLDPIKGHGALIESFPQVLLHCPEAHLILAGEGELRSIYEKRVEVLKIRGRVHFLGWRDDVDDLLEAADLFVLPSLNEGMGRAVVEAMAAGLAVVGTKVGGVPLIVEEGETGLLVPPKDTDSLASAIVRLLSNPDERRSMGSAGQRKAAEFSDEAMVDRLENLYRRILSSSPPVKAPV